MSEPEPRKAIYEIAVAELDREIRSADALSARAATLIGFCGVILGLAAAFGRDSLARDLGAVGRPLAAVALIGGVVVVLAGAVVAAATLTSRPRGRPKPAVLRELRGASEAEEAIYGRLSKSAITLYEEEGAKNDRRGRLLKAAVVAVVAGIALLAVQAVVVATTLTNEPCSRIQTSATTTTTTLPATAPSSRTIRVVTISSTGCAKASRKTKSAKR